jgi:hypothetical protein
MNAVVPCVEPECGQPRDHWNHARGNAAGHFFNADTPLLSAAKARQFAAQPSQEKPMIPGPRKRRTYVRRPKTEAPEPPPANDAEPIDDIIDRLPIQRPPSPPVVRTESLITEATVKSIRSIDIAPHCRIHRINVEPEYSIGDDAHLLSAEVTVKFSLIFPREDA